MMKFSVRKSILVLLSGLFILSGCADTRPFAKHYADIKNDQVKQELLAEQARQDALAKSQLASDFDDADSLYNSEFNSQDPKNCHDITSIGKILDRRDIGLNKYETLALIDLIITPFGKHICDDLVSFLENRYALTDASDLVTKRLNQLKRFSNSDQIQIIQTDKNVALNAPEVFGQMKQEQIQSKLTTDGKYVRLVGKIEGKRENGELTTINIHTDLPVNAFKNPNDPKIKEVAEATKGLEVRLEQNPQTKNVVGHTMPVEESSQLSQNTFKLISQKARNNKQAIEARKQTPGRLNFDTTMMNAINECGNDVTKDSRTVQATLTTLRATKNSIITDGSGGSIAILGIDVTENDNKTLGVTKPSESMSIYKSFASQPYTSVSTVVPETFFGINEASKCAVAYDIRIENESTATPSTLVLGFYAKAFKNFSDVEKVSLPVGDNKEAILVGYKLKKDVPSAADTPQWSLKVHLDFPSAAWLKLQTFRVMNCLISKGIASDKASLESLRTAALYSLLIDKVKGNAVLPSYLICENKSEVKSETKAEVKPEAAKSQMMKSNEAPVKVDAKAKAKAKSKWTLPTIGLGLLH